MEETLEYLGERPIHISFDIDGLDSNEAPSTGTPVSEGLTLEEGKYICTTVKMTKRLVGLDLVEVNPCLGGNYEDVMKTVFAAREIIKSAI